MSSKMYLVLCLGVITGMRTGEYVWKNQEVKVQDQKLNFHVLTEVGQLVKRGSWKSFNSGQRLCQKNVILSYL